MPDRGMTIREISLGSKEGKSGVYQRKERN